MHVRLRFLVTLQRCGCLSRECMNQHNWSKGPTFSLAFKCTQLCSGTRMGPGLAVFC